MTQRNNHRGEHMNVGERLAQQLNSVVLKTAHTVRARR
jgi:hypothetical protein